MIVLESRARPVLSHTYHVAPAAHTDQGRLASIDALRGMAALYVFFYHLALLPTPNLAVPAWIKDLILTGGTGVTLFFVVSAFTMCHSMRVHAEEPQLTVRFYLRRFFRIAPLFYAWMVASFLRDAFYCGVWHTPKKILLSAFFAYNFVPGQEGGFVWASWTLGVEMVFYLLFPLIFRYVRNLPQAVAFFVGTLLLSGLYHHFCLQVAIPDPLRGQFMQFSFLNMLPIFACGIVTFFIYEQFIRGRASNRTWSVLLICAAAYGYQSLLSGRMGFLLDPLYWQAIVYSLLLLGLTSMPWQFLVNRVTRFFGTISYSVYLNHPTLVFVLAPVYAKIYTLPIPITARYGLCAALTVPLLTLASWITYRCIEKPGMRVGNTLARRVAA